MDALNAMTKFGYLILIKWKSSLQRWYPSLDDLYCGYGSNNTEKSQLTEPKHVKGRKVKIRIENTYLKKGKVNQSEHITSYSYV